VAEGTIDPAQPCVYVFVDEGGVEQPQRHAVPYDTGENGEVLIGYTEIAGRAFMRTLGDDLVASDRIVRVQYFPLPPWGTTQGVTDGSAR
jgi:hypothetical protein